MDDSVEVTDRSQIDFSYAAAQVRAEQLRLRVGDKIAPPKTCSREDWPPNYDEVLAWRSSMLARFELAINDQPDNEEGDPELIRAAKKYYAANPVDFINHWIDTYDPRKMATGASTRFPFIMFPKQEELVQFVLACMRGQAPGLIEKSRDMGATWVCIGITIWLWLFHPGSAVGWGSNEQDQVDVIGVPDSIFEKIRMAIRALPDAFLPDGFQPDKNLFYRRCVNPENGSTIFGDIGDNIGRGGRSLIYFVDEAAHLAHPEKVEASLSETTRVRIDISSVSGLGTVFYRKRKGGQDWRPDVPVVRDRANVFIMDYSDHPEKDLEWFNQRKAFYTNSGTPAVFAREIARDYAAAVEGIIIQAEHVEAAFDAHKRLGIEESGAWGAALDVADGGQDTNALSSRRGIVLKYLEEWAERDTSMTTRRAVASCAPHAPLELQYDSIGVGSGVKGEANRLADEGLLPKGLTFVPWNAGGAVLNPYGHVYQLPNGDEDTKSPRNKDFYKNLKAQAWWMAARKFYAVYRAIRQLEGDPDHQDFTWEPDDLISIDTSTISQLILRKLQDELSQATASQTTSRMQLIVDKSPEGTNSPNLADSVIMNYWPIIGRPAPVAGIFGPMVVRGV